MTFIVAAAAVAGSIQAWLTAVPITATVQYFEHSAAALTRLWETVRVAFGPSDVAGSEARAQNRFGIRPARRTRRPQYPLPQAPGDPIPLLTRHGPWQQTGSCAVSLDFDETFTRTGD
jgi:hypothetical protein